MQKIALNELEQQNQEAYQELLRQPAPKGGLQKIRIWAYPANYISMPARF